MMGEWTFFSNYGHVLVCLAKNRESRLRDVALEVGITERAVQKIVRDLQEAGFLTVSKQGRCNRYRINNRKALRHSLEAQCTVGKLLSLILKSGTASPDVVVDDEAAAREATVAARANKRTRAPVVKSLPAEEPAEPLPEPAKTSTKKKTADSAQESRPVDTRQQGSLF
jgi:Mn-dependent DtxR family transcriptional regulator